MKTLNAGNLAAKKRKKRERDCSEGLPDEKREFFCRAARPNLSFSQVFREFSPAALLSSLRCSLHQRDRRGDAIPAGLVSSGIFQIIFAQIYISILETKMRHEKK